MTDVLDRIGALVAELRTIGCDVATDAATINITIRYPAPAGELDEPTARAIVEEIAAEPPAPKPARVTETRRPAKAPRGSTAPEIDWAEVARVARQAPAGEMQIAVAKHFEITKGAAMMRIRKARELGHDIPSPRSGMGPIERQPFDADKARAGAAEGVGAVVQVSQTTPGFPGPIKQPAIPTEPARTPLTDIAHLEALVDGSIDPDGDDAA